MKNALREMETAKFLSALILMIFTLLILLPTSAAAKCVCACVNGKMEAVCSSSGGMTGMKPMCAGMCPMAGPGMSGMGDNSSNFNRGGCRQEQVWNDATRRYEWKTICRD